jgi:hypothetical protein
MIRSRYFYQRPAGQRALGIRTLTTIKQPQRRQRRVVAVNSGQLWQIAYLTSAGVGSDVSGFGS